jgi:uncharacterized membrane protein YtjA (UPF0391 family)
MLGWALTFLIIALIAAALGFGGIAGAAAGIAKIIFFIFLVLLLASLVMHVARGRAASTEGRDTAKGRRLVTAPAFAFQRTFSQDQARSKRSAFITLVHAATKSFTNFSFASAQA